MYNLRFNNTECLWLNATKTKLMIMFVFGALDELYGDFEDLETGQVFTGGDDSTHSSDSDDDNANADEKLKGKIVVCQDLNVSEINSCQVDAVYRHTDIIIHMF